MSGWACVASCLIRFCVEALLAKAAFLSRGQGHLATWATPTSLVCCNVLPARFCLSVKDKASARSINCLCSDCRDDSRLAGGAVARSGEERSRSSCAFCAVGCAEFRSLSLLAELTIVGAIVFRCVCKSAWTVQRAGGGAQRRARANEISVSIQLTCK